MDAINKTAEDVTQKITDMLKRALTTANDNVIYRTAQLQSERNEFHRQLMEILFTEAFVK